MHLTYSLIRGIEQYDVFFSCSINKYFVRIIGQIKLQEAETVNQLRIEMCQLAKRWEYYFC
jgi:hypothetical protein